MMGKTSWAGDIVTRRLKSTWVATSVSFLSFSKALCVSVTIYESYLQLLSSYNSSNIERFRMSKPMTKRKEHKGESKSSYRLCVPPCPHYIKWAGIHTVCAWSDWGWSMQSIVSGFHCVRFAPGNLSLRREFSPAFLAVPAPLRPKQSGGCAHGNRRWIRWREWRWASPYLLPFPSDPAPLSGIRSPPCGSSPRRKGSTFRLSSSEEMDVEDIDELSQSLKFAQAYCEWI